jgi:hypothetical protein
MILSSMQIRCLSTSFGKTESNLITHYYEWARESVAMSHLKYTKLHDVMRWLLRRLREACKNAGALELKRLETDSPTGDKSLYQSIFPELKKGVIPSVYAPASEFAALSF